MKGGLMGQKRFSHYKLAVTAGPGFPECFADIRYYAVDGSLLGQHGVTLIGFCSTWKDMAEEVRNGLKLLNLDDDPVHVVSPMVDLS